MTDNNINSILTVRASAKLEKEVEEELTKPDPSSEAAKEEEHNSEDS